MKIKEFEFMSADGNTKLYGCCKKSEKVKIKGIVQIIHGAGEHSGMYGQFADFLCDNGFAVYCCDMPGHGKSGDGESSLSFLNREEHWKIVVSDLQSFTSIVKQDCQKRPVFLFGYDIGSLYARRLAVLIANEYAGIILSGTFGSIPASGVNLRIARKAVKWHGANSKSDYLDNLFSLSYNQKFKPVSTAHDWLTSDGKALEKYLDDPLRLERYPASLYVDFYSVLHRVSTKSWYRRLPQTMPVLLLSGANDPAGKSGKGIRGIYNELRRTNHNAVKMKLYDGARHDLMIEECREEVFADVCEWLSSYII